MTIDFTPLINAVTRFEEGLEGLAKDPDNSLIRDGVIQRFEFSYELSHKMLKRYLEATSANPAEIDIMTFQDLIRTGSEQGLLLSGWDKWRDFRQARTDTSHTYDEDKALKVIARLPAFLDEARYLLTQLQARNA
jgi:nucleotidyltransferase substrate binding protein (TIGR01987 family)